VQQHGPSSSQEPWTTRTEKEDTNDVMFHTLSDSSLLLPLEGRGTKQLRAHSPLAHSAADFHSVGNTLYEWEMCFSEREQVIKKVFFPTFLNSRKTSTNCREKSFYKEDGTI